MPKFKIYGARGDTGEEVTATITADTLSDAESVASGRGIMVSRVVEVEVERAPATHGQPSATGRPAPPQADRPRCRSY